MWSALILILFIFVLPYSILGEGTYECGDHGRFEYCIDEIPGCVIGCHCHPGYFFDTDTKICEPNSKLIEHHRRQNVIEPIRVNKVDVTPNVIYDTQTASSPNKIDSHIDEITKDANDLGDWLYNQFFKTIENQVINNTNDTTVLTRRSGPQHPTKRPMRKKKWHKGKSSKQRGKKGQLRKKLLRITENDSLFDISSKSSSDSSDSSSSVSSVEYETNEYHHNHDDDDEHGHKKIVMINKKPKRPLPSFIFLPNLDTPFYPPIGLPPPPIVQMYPMVPVPPVPLCPITGCDENRANNIETTISSTVTASTTTTTTTSTTITTAAGSTTTTSVPSSLSETAASITITADEIKTTDSLNPEIKSLRIKNKKKKKGGKIYDNDKIQAEQGINRLKAIERQKILERLKEKINNPSAKLFMPSWKRNKKIFANKFANQNVDAESPFLDNGLSEDVFINNEIQPKFMQEDLALPDNVDFKYITELIHRVDLNNKSNELSPIEYKPMDSIEGYRPSKIHKNEFSHYSVPFDIPNGRRLNRPTYQPSDESYYTNLGRQIATMIRGIDTQKGQLSIEFEETPNKRKNDIYFNNNSPSSFWERSVRSPLTYLKANNKKFEYLKRSNELLFDIENKVEIIASTAPALSLHEIENIVNVMEAAKREIKSKDKHLRNLSIANKNLNINLWPQKSHQSRSNLQNSLSRFTNTDIQEKNIIDMKTNNNKILNPTNAWPGVHMQSVPEYLLWNAQNANSYVKANNQNFSMQTTVKPLNKKRYFEAFPINKNIERPYQPNLPAKANPFSQNTIKQSLLSQNMNPLSLTHRKYFQDNNNYNYYIDQKEGASQLPTAIKFAGVQPSYFHHEIKYFDYME